MNTQTPKRRDRRARNNPWWTRIRRVWAYGVLVAAGGVALTYGLATAEQVAAWLVLGAALLGVSSIAITHLTPDKETGHETTIPQTHDQ